MRTLAARGVEFIWNRLRDRYAAGFRWRVKVFARFGREFKEKQISKKRKKKKKLSPSPEPIENVSFSSRYNRQCARRSSFGKADDRRVNSYAVMYSSTAGVRGQTCGNDNFRLKLHLATVKVPSRSLFFGKRSRDYIEAISLDRYVLDAFFSNFHYFGVIICVLS